MKLITAQGKEFEIHTMIEKVIRIFSVPLLNHVPPTLLQRIMKKTSHDARTVVQNTGSTLALEVMYTHHHRNPFNQSILKGVIDTFWHNVVSQPKALRNRLYLVERLLEEEIARRIVEEQRNVTIVTLGGGSSRALIHSISRLLKETPDARVEVTTIDKDVRAIELSKVIAADFGVTHVFRWIHDDVGNTTKYIQENSVDIIEMVGLLDYFPENMALHLLQTIRTLLKEQGAFIFANVHPNKEMPFVSHLGWPRMYYREPEDLERLVEKVGFMKDISIIYEPLLIHMVAILTK